MWTIKILFGMIIFGLSSASTFKDKPDSIPVVTSEENINSVSATIRSLETNNGIQRSESTSNVEARKKKDGMQMMYMMFMMCKSGISSLMSLTQPVFQLKALSISFIGMLINIARFIMQLKASQAGGGGAGGSQSVSGGGGWSGEDRIGRPNFRPNYITRYTIHE